jgi:hypothetical protein
MQGDKEHVIYFVAQGSQNCISISGQLFGPIAELVSINSTSYLETSQLCTRHCNGAATRPPSGTISAWDGPAPNASQALKAALAVLDKETLLGVLQKIVGTNPVV